MKAFVIVALSLLISQALGMIVEGGEKRILVKFFAGVILVAIGIISIIFVAGAHF